MFKFGTQRMTWMAVRWNGLLEDGSPIENEIRCKVELVDRTRLKSQLEAERDADGDTSPFAISVTRDWSGVGDEGGSPLPFSTERFTGLLEAPGFIQAWGVAYLLAWNGQSGIREKNSGNSPAAGQPAVEASQPKEA